MILYCSAWLRSTKELPRPPGNLKASPGAGARAPGPGTTCSNPRSHPPHGAGYGPSSECTWAASSNVETIKDYKDRTEEMVSELCCTLKRWKTIPRIFQFYVYACIYIFVCVCVRTSVPGSQFGGPPPNGMVPPPSQNIYHLHGICSIWESQPPICMLCAAFQSHNLRLAPFLQQLKPICYDLRAVPMVTYLVSICFFSIVYTYIQAIAYLYTIHANDWCITNAISTHRTYIALIA